ncbi:N-formylglutamate amidohydrolase [Faunimonas pinastri]|uniref:N-formylglutamate amidohydrolase n=1 Tax=Faunimonas pinastri TaxID=1855383 RepID=A0A1H9P5L1_9HYPH|nr:N-formylglutamate amidohydrolase [Faunimonas pinastri]SER43377.1 N-formylglutamate amidohydrolase [Faunimonas pinastri]
MGETGFPADWTADPRDPSRHREVPFQIRRPDHQFVPFVFNSPHSGSFYPEAFLAASCLDRQSIRRSEDFMVDALFGSVGALGAPLMRAVYPRAYLDVNREPYELDPRMFSDRLPPFANVRSLRVAGGLGTIPRIVSDTAPIYRSPLRVEEAMARIRDIYHPYHEALSGLLLETHETFGQAVLIDCHSMPSHLKGVSARSRPDFVLGDRFGTSCMPELTEAAVQFLVAQGYNVARNKPYAGGFITEHYGRPYGGLHTLQIEVNRALYMDEAALAPHEGFDDLRANLEGLAQALIETMGTFSLPLALREAAE